MAISESLAGRQALVTGGTRGQGAAIVARLREAGAQVMTTARSMPDGYPEPKLFVAADAATAAGASQIVAAVQEKLGRLDTWTLSAGYRSAARPSRTRSPNWSRSWSRTGRNRSTALIDGGTIPTV